MLDYSERKDAIEILCPGNSYRLDESGGIVFWDGPHPLPADADLEAVLPQVYASRVQASAEAQKAQIAEGRWLAETGGLVLPNGAEIKTDRESQALLTGAAFSATLDPETPIEWKGANGWVVLMPQEVLQIAGLVRRHVQGCFSRERALSAQVEAIAQDEALSDSEKVEAIRAVHW